MIISKYFLLSSETRCSRTKRKKKQESNTANCHTIFDKSFIATEFQAKNESEMQFYTQMELDQHIGSA